MWCDTYHSRKLSVIRSVLYLQYHIRLSVIWQCYRHLFWHLLFVIDICFSDICCRASVIWYMLHLTLLSDVFIWYLLSASVICYSYALLIFVISDWLSFVLSSSVFSRLSILHAFFITFSPISRLCESLSCCRWCRPRSCCRYELLFTWFQMLGAFVFPLLMGQVWDTILQYIQRFWR
jgi:hypothetical protein